MSWCMSVMPALGKQRLKELEFKVMVPRLQSEASLKKNIYIYMLKLTFVLTSSLSNKSSCGSVLGNTTHLKSKAGRLFCPPARFVWDCRKHLNHKEASVCCKGLKSQESPKLIKRHREEELKRELPGQKCKLSDNKAWKC